MGQGAGSTGRLLGMAAASSVEDHSMRQHRPIPSFEQRTNLRLNFDGVIEFSPAEPATQPTKMCIDRYSRDTEGISQDDIGCLASNTGQGHKFVQRVWQFAIKPLTQLLSEPNN